MAEAAPLYTELGEGLAGGTAHWLRSVDGVRIRVAVWPEGRRGTALIFPGRTEYIEKYADVVARLKVRGFSVVVIDWRGQGLSDRAYPGKTVGHVGNFQEFQLDIGAVVTAPELSDLPRPRWLLAHSMGGCIGLRALNLGLSVERAVFSAPMWGLPLPLPARLLAKTLGGAANLIGREGNLLPGSSTEFSTLEQPYEGNVLTSDPEMYADLQAQLHARPDLGLSGPTIGWINAALREMSALESISAPTLPMLTFLGSDEEVVSPSSIRRTAARMPEMELVDVPGARHEGLMETPTIRNLIWLKIDQFIDPTN